MKILRMSLAVAAFLACFHSFGSAQSTSPATPGAGAAAPATAAPSPSAGTTTRVGAINIERAVVECNEGRRDFDALDKKLEPKKNDLKGQNDELEGLQKQLQTTGDKLNGDALANLQKQIDTKKKAFDRSMQDAQEDATNQQKEIFQRILGKMGPVIVKYAQDNGIGVIVDTTNPWPQSPILWRDEAIDITKAIVDAYNAQSGVPAPAAGSAKAPPRAPASTAPKTAAPKSTEPPK